MKKMRVKVSRWLTGKKVANRVPLRTMEAEIVEVTKDQVYLKLNGFLEANAECLHCGTTLKHPISKLYGLGPVCGKHFYVSPVKNEEELEERIEEMKQQLASQRWEGWLKKSSIKLITFLVSIHMKDDLEDFRLQQTRLHDHIHAERTQRDKRLRYLLFFSHRTNQALDDLDITEFYLRKEEASWEPVQYIYELHLTFQGKTCKYEFVLGKPDPYQGRLLFPPSYVREKEKEQIEHMLAAYCRELAYTHQIDLEEEKKNSFFAP